MNKENVRINNEEQIITDHIKRFVEKESDEELSPMNPPDAYSPPTLESVNYEDYHPLIQKFLDEHKIGLKALEKFENVLSKFQNEGLTSNKEFNEGLKDFFTFFDNKVTIHNLKEEKILFPLLQERLLVNGEHSSASSNEIPKTVIDMLEDDHIKMIQLASVTFNFLGLASRLPDPKSRAITLDASLEQGKRLIELLRLHIFREDNVVFPLSHKYIKKEEFDLMDSKVTMYDHY